MFWDRVAGVYDLFVNVYNRKVHSELKRTVVTEIEKGSTVLECACGTGMLTEVMAPLCTRLIATDLSQKMLKHTEKKCRKFSNVETKPANILELDFPDNSFDAVVAANVIHLLDEPVSAMHELSRVCKNGGKLIVPTYMNSEKSGKTNAFSAAAGKAGADFKREFTFDSYRKFFRELDYEDVRYKFIKGRVPCAVAVIRIMKQ